MKTVTKLNNGYTLIAIEPCEDSPMEDHKGMSIAADDENRMFYVYQTTLVCYGIDSVAKACESYPVAV